MSNDDSDEQPLRQTHDQAQPNREHAPQPAPPPPAAPSAPPRSATWRLNPAGVPLTAGPGTAPAIPLPSRPFQANSLLVLAQLLAVVQGALGVVTGTNLIRGASTLNEVAAGVNMSGASRTTVVAYGIATVAVGAVVIVAAVLIGHPSMIARVVVALWAFVVFWVSLAAFYHGGSVLGFFTVVVFAASGGALLPAAAVLTFDAVLFYALAVHPPTYRAFAEHGTSLSWEQHSPSPYPSPPPPRNVTRSPTPPPAGSPAMARAQVASRPAPAPSLPPPSSFQEASVPSEASDVQATPRKGVKLPGMPATSRKRRPSAPASTEMPSRAPAPMAQARDYSPAKRTNPIDREPTDTQHGASAADDPSG